MSMENARALVKKLQSDKALQSEISSRLEKAFSIVAASENLSCSLSDFNNAVKTVSVNKSRVTIDKRIGDKAIVAIASVAVI